MGRLFSLFAFLANEWDLLSNFAKYMSTTITKKRFLLTSALFFSETSLLLCCCHLKLSHLVKWMGQTPLSITVWSISPWGYALVTDGHRAWINSPVKGASSVMPLARCIHQILSPGGGVYIFLFDREPKPVHSDPGSSIVISVRDWKFSASACYGESYPPGRYLSLPSVLISPSSRGNGVHPTQSW